MDEKHKKVLFLWFEGTLPLLKVCSDHMNSFMYQYSTQPKHILSLDCAWALVKFSHSSFQWVRSQGLTQYQLKNLWKENYQTLNFHKQLSSHHLSFSLLDFQVCRYKNSLHQLHFFHMSRKADKESLVRRNMISKSQKVQDLLSHQFIFQWWSKLLIVSFKLDSLSQQFS